LHNEYDQIEKELEKGAKALEQKAAKTEYAEIHATWEMLFYNETPDEASLFLTHQITLSELRLRFQNLDLREENAKHLRRFAIYWSVAVCAIIITKGILNAIGLDFISERLLLALVGGTTVNVLGLYAIVVKNLFPNK
jgi:hypothetical protein